MQSQVVLLVTLLSAATSFAAAPLIDGTTRNGSFESGLSEPWRAYLQVTQDHAFASHGSWYATVAKLAGTLGTEREGSSQLFPASPTNGRSFLLSFDARIGTNGWDSLSVDFFARHGDGTFIGATEVPLAFPTLSTSEWRRYQLQYQLPETWDGSGSLTLGILFSKTGAVSGITYVGYLDNVTLQQVSEPPVLQTFDRIFQGDDPTESFRFSRTFDPAVRATIRFVGFVENLSTFDETGARFLVGWGQTENDLEETIFFPEGHDMGVRFPAADPVLGPVRVPLEIVAKTDYWPASLRFDVEGLGCCDYFRLVGTLTILPTPEPELRITRLDSAAARITWTTNSTGYVLECATNLPAVTWSPVTNTISRAGTTFSVTVNTDESFKVFRLSRLLITE